MNNNNQNELPEEEIPNLEQFQVGRAPSDQDEEWEEDMDDLSGAPDDLQDDLDEDEDAGYTDDEIEYADGEGTLLDDEIDDEDDDEI